MAVQSFLKKKTDLSFSQAFFLLLVKSFVEKAHEAVEEQTLIMEGGISLKIRTTYIKDSCNRVSE